MLVGTKFNRLIKNNIRACFFFNSEAVLRIHIPSDKRIKSELSVTAACLRFSIAGRNMNDCPHESETPFK